MPNQIKKEEYNLLDFFKFQNFKFIYLLISTSIFGQNFDIVVLESNNNRVVEYKFDKFGKVLSFTRFYKDTINEKYKFNYQNNLLDEITILKKDTLKKKFIYDKKFKLLAQINSGTIDTIKFCYDFKDRINQIKNYYESDIQYKYIDSISNVVAEKTSKSSNTNFLDYYTITKYSYDNNKITEDLIFYSPYGEKKESLIKEYKDKKIVKKTNFYNNNQFISSSVTHYIYDNQGFLKTEINKCEVKDFIIKSQVINLETNIVKKINCILIGDFESIGWY